MKPKLPKHEIAGLAFIVLLLTITLSLSGLLGWFMAMRALTWAW